MSPHTLLAQRLRDARMATGRSLRDVAAELGPAWTYVKVNQLELGKQHVRVTDLLALARLYSVAPEDFVSGLLDSES